MTSPAEQFTAAMYQIERRAEARARRVWRETRQELADLLDSGPLVHLPVTWVVEILTRAAMRMHDPVIGTEIYNIAARLVMRQTGRDAPVVTPPFLSYEPWRLSATGIFAGETGRLQTAGADAAALRARLLTGSDGRAGAWELALNSLILATALLVWGHGNGLVVRMGRAASERDDIEYQKQAIAHLDARTTPICKAVNDQIRPLDKPFDTKAGRIMNPPFHHRCRTAVVLYHPSFEATT